MYLLSFGLCRLVLERGQSLFFLRVTRTSPDVQHVKKKNKYEVSEEFGGSKIVWGAEGVCVRRWWWRLNMKNEL